MSFHVESAKQDCIQIEILNKSFLVLEIVKDGEEKQKYIRFKIVSTNRVELEVIIS